MSKFLTLAEVLSNRPVQTPLAYGIYENIRLVAISNERKFKDQEPLQYNTYMTFVEYNEKGEKKASSTFNFFDLDSTRENVLNDFATQIEQLTSIARIYVEDAELDPLGSDYESLEELEKAMKNPKTCKALTDKLYNLFEDVVKDHIGEQSVFVRLKVVVNAKNFPQLSRNLFIESSKIPAENTQLSFTKYERDTRMKALESIATPKAADAPGDAPTAKQGLASI